MASIYTFRGEEGLLLVMRMKAVYIAFSDTTLMGASEHLVTASWEWKKLRFLIQSLMVWVGPSFFLVTGWNRAVIFYVFCLMTFSLSWSFVEREQAFLEAFLGLFLWVELLASSALIQKKENQGSSSLCCSLSPEVPTWSAFFFPFFRVFLCLFYK